MALRRSRSSALLSAAAVCAVVVAGLSAAQATAAPRAASPAAHDDVPVKINVKGDSGDDDAGFAKLRDAYYWSRLLAGDGGGITPDTAAALRAKAAQQTSTATPLATRDGVPSGSWTSQGGDPVVQVARTSNTLEAVSGRVTALVVKPDGSLIAGGAQGGVWTYDQNTGVWTSRSANTDTQSVGALAESASNPSVVYLGTGESSLSGDSYYGNGIYRSDDGGTTWRKVSGNAFVGVSTSGLVVDPTDPNHLFVSTIRGRAGSARVSAPGTKIYGVYESTDGGGSWTLRKGTTDEIHGATDLVMDPQNPAVLWASFWGDAIYRTTDSGATWAPVMGNLPAGDFTEGGTRFALGLSHPKGAATATVYAGFDYFDADGTYHPSRLYKTTTDGATWTATATGSGEDSILGYCGTQCYYDNVVRPDPTNPNTVYLLGLYNYDISSGGVYRSTDGGATWTGLGYDLHPDFHAFAFQPNNTQHVALGNDGGIWQSFAGGGRNRPTDPLSSADWQDLNGQVDPTTGALIHSTGLRIGQFQSIATVPYVPGEYWGGTQDNGTQRKSTLNDRWYDQGEGDGGNLFIDQTTKNPLSPNLPAFVFGEHYDISPFRFDPTGVGEFGGYQEIDGGIDMSDRSEFYVPMVGNRAKPNQLFLGTYRLYRTDNAETADASAVKWTPISGDLTGGCTQAAPNGARGCLISALGLADGGTGVYVGTDDGYLQVSRDAMTTTSPTFTRVGVGTLPDRPVSAFAVDRSNWRHAYVAYAGFSAATPDQAGHVWQTVDGGAHWVNDTANLPDVPVDSLVQDPSSATTLYAGTDVGVYVTTDGGHSWSKLGTGMPTVAVFGLDYDATNGVLAAGTHGRGVYTLTNPTATPALVVSSATPSTPVGPGSPLTFTVTLRNVGNAAATGVKIVDPVPADTAYVSSSAGGSLYQGVVTWTGLSVPAGGSTSVTLSLRIAPTVGAGVRSVTDDGIAVGSAQGVGTTGSPDTVVFAAPRSVSVSPGSTTGGARPDSLQTYPLTVHNRGYQPDQYALGVSSTWPARVLASDCSTPLTTTAAIAPGASATVCLRVGVPPGVASASSNTATVSATSTGASAVVGRAKVTTIAFTKQVLLVDEDGNNPDVKSYYETALGSTPYDYWDLAAVPSLPATVLGAHKTVVWFTGTSYPNPLGRYEPALTTFLNGGGRLFLSGQDILDQTAGTAPFVRTYLHVDWDGSERQNDKPTSTITAVSANPVTGALGTVTLNHAVLNSPYEDQVTPISPAAAAFTDDTGADDGLTVSAGAYRVLFIAFPFEEYGTAAQKAAFMAAALRYLS